MSDELQRELEEWQRSRRDPRTAALKYGEAVSFSA
jgi:hypothetical protein